MKTLEFSVIEPVAAHTKTVVWLHGIGQDASAFEPVVRRLALPERGIRSVLATASRQQPSAKGGHITVWFDQVLSRLNEVDPAMLDAAIDQVWALLEQEALTVGWERVVLAGFSQGATLALVACLRHPQRLGGLVLYAPYLLRQSNLRETRSPTNVGTPVWIGYARGDRMIPPVYSERIHELLKKVGYAVEIREYAGDHETFLGVEYEDLQNII